jgi:hypothetical protein
MKNKENLRFFSLIKIINKTFDYLLSVFDDLNYVQLAEEKMIKYELVEPFHQLMEY